MNLTPSQSEAVEHRAGNLLVSASAGSGKTEVLARRCISLIGDGDCDVDRLLVVTFTRAAAAELRVRIAGKLHEKIAKGDIEPKLRDHLRRQAVLVHSADICTLDSWCGRIVREHFTVAGVDPGFTTLDEEQARLLRQQVLDEVFDSIYAGNCDVAEAAQDWLGRNASTGDRFLREMVSALDRFLNRLAAPAAWFAARLNEHERDEGALIADARGVLARALADEIERQRSGLAGVLAAAGDGPVTERLQAYLDSLTIWRGRLDQQSESLSGVLSEIAEFKLRPGRGKNQVAATPLLTEVEKHWHGKRLKDRWKVEDIESIIERAPQTSKLTATLFRLTAFYRESLAAVKRERAAYEFSDVERMALDLLGRADESGSLQPTPIARVLRGRYTHILVDEYQDTSPVQAAMLQLITPDGVDANRFMVGDVKQSIYRFRQADPRLFAEQLRKLDSGELAGRAIHLSDNFRSHERLLAGLNAVFAMLFDPSLGGSEYGQREALRARRDDVANPTLDGESRIEVHVLEAERTRRSADEAEEGPDDEVALERIEREAWLAAGRIREMLAADTRVPQLDADGAVVLRPIAKSDIVILLRSAKVNAGKIAAVLRDAGIACVTSGRESLVDSVEVRDVLNVLDLIANRRQDVAMAGYLRGPLVGLTPDELLALRRQSPGLDYAVAAEVYCESGGDAALKTKAAAALGQLDRWCVAARNLELPALLRTIYREGALELFARALPGGRHRVAMLRALERYASDFAATGRHGVSEFIEYLEDLTDRQLDPETAAAVGEDVVRIMTIHAAKGLEFPFVFLLNAGAEFSRRPSKTPLRCDKEIGIGLNFLDYPARKRLISPQHHLLKYDEALGDLEEEMRLLYVAATRTREKLFIVGHTTPSTRSDIAARCVGDGSRPPLMSLQMAGSMLEWCLWGVSASGCDKPGGDRQALVSVTARPAVEVTRHDQADDGESTEPTEWNDHDERWVEQGARLIAAGIDRQGADTPAVLSASAIKSHAFEAVREEEPASDRYVARVGSLRAPEFVEAEIRADGTAVGSAVHQFLQHADFSRLGSASHVREQLETLVADRRLSLDDADLVTVDDIVWFAGTAEGVQLAAAAEACRRELPFVFSVPVGDDRILVRGVIDCLVELDLGMTIIDYKTDRVANEREFEQRLAGYRCQIQMYAWAAAEIGRQPVKRGLLVFLSARRMVDVPLERPRIDLLLASGDAER